MEWKVYLNTVRNGNYQVARLGWEAVVLDPHDFLEQFRTGSSNNWTGWSSPEYDRILEQSEKTADNAERHKLLQQLDAMIEREMPIIPIYHHTHRSLVLPVVKGFPDNAINIKIFQQTRLDPNKSTVDRRRSTAREFERMRKPQSVTPFGLELMAKAAYLRRRGQSETSGV